MVAEFKLLHTGIAKVLDGSILVSSSPSSSSGSSSTAAVTNLFTLRALIAAVGADMPARDTLMGLSGYGAVRYCRARGIWNGHIYCPIMPPTDLEARREDTHLTYDPCALPLRQHERPRQQALHVRDTGDEVTTERTGLKAYTILWELKSIIFPW